MSQLLQTVLRQKISRQPQAFQWGTLNHPYHEDPSLPSILKRRLRQPDIGGSDVIAPHSDPMGEVLGLKSHTKGFVALAMMLFSVPTLHEDLLWSVGLLRKKRTLYRQWEDIPQLPARYLADAALLQLTLLC